jgi:hypothetical protein
MEPLTLSLSWKSASWAATQEFLKPLWNSKLHYRDHKSLPLVPNLRLINSVHTTPSYLITILILSSHLYLGLPNVWYLERWRNQIPLHGSFELWGRLRSLLDEVLVKKEPVDIGCVGVVFLFLSPFWENTAPDVKWGVEVGKGFKIYLCCRSTLWLSSS